MRGNLEKVRTLAGKITESDVSKALISHLRLNPANVLTLDTQRGILNLAGGQIATYDRATCTVALVDRDPDRHRVSRTTGVDCAWLKPELGQSQQDVYSAFKSTKLNRWIIDPEARQYVLCAAGVGALWRRHDEHQELPPRHRWAGPGQDGPAQHDRGGGRLAAGGGRLDGQHVGVLLMQRRESAVAAGEGLGGHGAQRRARHRRRPAAPRLQRARVWRCVGWRQDAGQRGAAVRSRAGSSHRAPSRCRACPRRTRCSPATSRSGRRPHKPTSRPRWR